MDPTAKAAAHLLAQRLSSLQEELEEKLNRPHLSGPVEELRELSENIRQLRAQLEKIK
ncbi:MAG: hypothetical protein GX052_08695 [Syntrophomonadaceae bacterium]|jgi:hypothetical protein|nr:hypothetical protein [Syntrophomonadaceae bacterium]